MASRRQDLIVIGALWLMVLASSSQVMIIAPILPRIGDALGVPEALRGTLITGYAIALSSMAIIAGPISDRIGRRRILLFGTGAMTLALVLHPFSNSFGTLLAARVFAGMAGGILTGSAVSYVGDYFPYERRGWASGWVMSGFAVGQIAGVPAGTLLADAYGYRAPFALFAVLMGLAFVVTALRVPQPDVNRSAESLGVGRVLARYVQLLRNPAVSGAAAAYAAMFFSISTFVIYLPTWGEASLGMTASDVAIMFGVGGVANIIVGPRAGKLSDRFGRRPLILASCVGTAVLFTTATFWVTGVASAWVLFFVTMVLVATRISPFQALLTALAPTEQRGSLMSLVVAVGQVGGGIGGAVAGLIYAQAGFLGCTLVAAVALLVTAAIVATRIPEPGRA
ncbi:MAG: MFS transporter [Nannocystaceae bacterium]|nr:MFS transporter [bacterium]